MIAVTKINTKFHYHHGTIYVVVDKNFVSHFHEKFFVFVIIIIIKEWIFLFDRRRFFFRKRKTFCICNFPFTYGRVVIQIFRNCSYHTHYRDDYRRHSFADLIGVVAVVVAVVGNHVVGHHLDQYFL